MCVTLQTFYKAHIHIMILILLVKSHKPILPLNFLQKKIDYPLKTYMWLMFILIAIKNDITKYPISISKMIYNVYFQI